MTIGGHNELGGDTVSRKQDLLADYCDNKDKNLVLFIEGLGDADDIMIIPPENLENQMDYFVNNYNDSLHYLSHSKQIIKTWVYTDNVVAVIINALSGATEDLDTDDEGFRDVTSNNHMIYTAGMIYDSIVQYEENIAELNRSRDILCTNDETSEISLEALARAMKNEKDKMMDFQKLQFELQPFVMENDKGGSQ
ncbi:hypothetical protein BpsS140_00010 [Bacillus phage vB_BpsS-140]|nr:hypothetical protein BpsS140_00010 [Bacillus phage vB_BpsS-140]